METIIEWINNHIVFCAVLHMLIFFFIGFYFGYTDKLDFSKKE